MRTFHCQNCRQLVFFENVKCLNCDHALAYLPDLEDMGALEADGRERWRTCQKRPRRYHLCRNYLIENICNWAIPLRDSNPLCKSCRLTRVIPDLARAGNRQAWYRLEAAKRRLIYTLNGLHLGVRSKLEDPEHGLAFEFLEDCTPAKVITGHANGVITLSVAEANDAEREKRRLALHEPYRTLLGHFRHESAHYYWDKLLKPGARLEEFRALFGDERNDYGKALEHYYSNGPPADWQTRFLSAYASAHPWEDWAETWAHYLHMVDTLQTAISSDLSLRPRRSGEPVLQPNLVMIGCRPVDFERMIEAWFPLTYLLNNLNRGLGLPDGYPFVLCSQAIQKLRFVHETVTAAATPALAVPQPAGEHA